MSKRLENIEHLVENITEEMGLYIYDLELQLGRQLKVLLRVDKKYKETPAEGITVSELTRLNKLLGRALELEEVIEANYTLEVSSPGLERPLKSLPHYLAAVGESLDIVVTEAVAGKHRFTGQLVEVNEELIILQLAETKVELPFSQIRRAKTVFTL
jgi:ribosome maturation factor RimP